MIGSEISDDRIASAVAEVVRQVGSLGDGAPYKPRSLGSYGRSASPAPLPRSSDNSPSEHTTFGMGRVP